MNTRFRRRSFALLLTIPLLLAGQALAGGEPWEVQKIWDGPRKPEIDLMYGFGRVNQRLLQGTPADVGQLQINMGYMRARSHSPGIADLDEKLFLFDYATSTLFGKSVPAENIGSTLIRFGLGSRTGYAYDFGGSFLYPYHQTAITWTKVTTTRPAGLSANDTDILNRYEGTFRFGALTEGGLAYGFGDVVSIRAGYEASVIYPRHVFWPWLGSFLIAGIGVGAVSHFGDDIVEGSPTLGPIIYMLLRAGVAYGYFLTVRDNQYWPFSSETPMTTEAFKVGVSLTF